MAKIPMSKPENKSKQKSTNPKAVIKAAQNLFYRNAGFKNSRIVLGNDALLKLNAISEHHFDIKLDGKGILKEETGFMISSLINMAYNNSSDESYEKIEAAFTLKAMQLYHCYQTASYLHKSLCGNNNSKNINYIKIRSNMTHCPTLDEILEHGYKSQLYQYWSNKAIDLVLDKYWVNGQIIRLNNKKTQQEC